MEEFDLDLENTDSIMSKDIYEKEFSLSKNFRVSLGNKFVASCKTASKALECIRMRIESMMYEDEGEVELTLRYKEDNDWRMIERPKGKDIKYLVEEKFMDCFINMNNETFRITKNY